MLIYKCVPAGCKTYKCILTLLRIYLFNKKKINFILKIYFNLNIFEQKLVLNQINIKYNYFLIQSVLVIKNVMYLEF